MITLTGIDKRYDGRMVLDGFTMSLGAHERVAFVGPSGSGKTTALRILMGLEAPDSGERTQPESTRFSAVFQEHRLVDALDGVSNLMLAADGSPEKRRRMSVLLEEAALADQCHTRVCDYSGGMKTRLSILRALLSDFDVLILDEPFTGLDRDMKARMIAMIDRELAERALILVTHDRDDAAALGCSRHLNFWRMHARDLLA